MTGYQISYTNPTQQELRVVTDNPLILNLLLSTVETTMKLQSNCGSLVACNGSGYRPPLPGEYYPDYV